MAEEETTVETMDLITVFRKKVLQSDLCKDLISNVNLHDSAQLKVLNDITQTVLMIDILTELESISWELHNIRDEIVTR